MAKRFFYVCAGLLMLAASYDLGTRNASAAGSMVIPTEVATLSGVLNDGETIPLPVYADGTTALESECKWTVALHHIGSGPPPGGSGWWREETCSADGRLVHCFAYAYNSEWFTLAGDVNYLIIATRGTGGPTAVQSQSFGSLKAKYR